MKYGYHGTNSAGLLSIAEKGLEPRQGMRGHGVFFVDNEEHAKLYGDRVLRFRWPTDARETEESDDPDVMYYLSRSAIHPADIKVFIDEKWISLARKSGEYDGFSNYEPNKKLFKP